MIDSSNYKPLELLGFHLKVTPTLSVTFKDRRQASRLGDGVGTEIGAFGRVKREGKAECSNRFSRSSQSIIQNGIGAGNSVRQWVRRCNLAAGTIAAKYGGR